LEDPGIYGRIILTGSKVSRMGGVDWIDLAVDRDV
jgi:hypothetical protein